MFYLVQLKCPQLQRCGNPDEAEERRSVRTLLAPETYISISVRNFKYPCPQLRTTLHPLLCKNPMHSPPSSPSVSGSTRYQKANGLDETCWPVRSNIESRPVAIETTKKHCGTVAVRIDPGVNVAVRGWDWNYSNGSGAELFRRAA